ncbi:MAG TPA: hypothetical protein VNZ03_01250 [Terriglobales bacterium]|jgi:hypothetical protein|nr:hypothetical protein [Terriglobales bacterium]
MAKLIDSIRLFLLRLIFPPSVLTDVQIEAKLQNVSVITLVRSVMEKYLRTRTVRMRLDGRTVHLKLEKVDMNEPVGDITPGQQGYADEVMRIFREEDR